MLKAKQMTRTVVVGHKDVLDKTVEVLHDSNIFHIEDFNETDSSFKIGKPFENAGDVSKKLVKLRAISNFLGIKSKDIPKRNPEDLWRDLDNKLTNLENELNAKTEEKAKLEAKLKELESLQKELEPLAAIPVNLENYKGYENIAVFTGYVREDVRSAISAKTTDFELEYDAQNSIIALFVRKDKESAVAEILADYAFREIRVPASEGKPSEVISASEKEKDSINKEISSLEKAISSVKEKYADFILASDELLSIESQKSEAPLRMATSEHTFVIDGWVPEEEYSKLENIVNAATNGRVFVSKQEAEKKDEDKTPVEYENPKLTKPFELIMDLYARPKYKEIDPTLLIFFTFPLFYGMILGDIGYALVLLGVAFAVKKFVRFEAIKTLMNILIICQISTLFFGILYAEFFGFALASLHTDHGTVPGLIAGFETINLFASPIGNEMITYPLHRTHLAMTLIAFTTLIGVAHINFGYILGLININRAHGFKHAMLEKGSWLVIELGILAVVLGFLGYFPVIIGALIFLIGFIMLVKGEGIKGPIELPSLLSNSLSYTRLIAVGLSSIYIAFTVNLIAWQMIWPKGGIAAILAIIVFIFGHAVNTVLSIIAPGLHALRLQYVEFFTKFYEGGGRKYDPFGYIRKYTEE
ncbi:V/A-type H+-transporting ATPase subunit I [Methanohalophilus levihalophilus]|uniref:V-type ATP synthase subunit I n=1 Tax=Methanohalophilus levihalophilus TaxID=1431282 RepID=UPI001AE6A5DF|nr:V-type ATP synthase subunit I [Methanohalophilus levihalophilus]MBP2031044.1 V/A-type H+-transporting ATPase subunit I [Methanohalophilus levihalophilus]